MLFPLFGSGAGDYYLIDCANNNQTQGTIFYFSPSDPDFDGMISIYDSLDKLLHTVSECYKLGAYFFNDNQLQIKYELEKGISINKNPESHFWKL